MGTDRVDFLGSRNFLADAEWGGRQKSVTGINVSVDGSSVVVPTGSGRLRPTRGERPRTKRGRGHEVGVTSSVSGTHECGGPETLSSKKRKSVERSRGKRIKARQGVQNRLCRERLDDTVQPGTGETKVSEEVRR